MPTALAMAEYKGVNGSRLLQAIAAGYNVGARTTKALGFSGPVKTGVKNLYAVA